MAPSAVTRRRSSPEPHDRCRQALSALMQRRPRCRAGLRIRTDVGHRRQRPYPPLPLILLPTFEMGADLSRPSRAVTKWQRSRKRQDEEPPVRPGVLVSGRYQTRTDDLFRVKEARYQLRQSPDVVEPILEHTGSRARVGFWPPPRVRLESVRVPGRDECGCSAVGSASPCQGEGREFESRHPLECGDPSGVHDTWVEPHTVAWPSG